MEKYTYYYQSKQKKPNRGKKKLSKREAARRRHKRNFYIRLYLRIGLFVAIIVMIILSIRLIVKSSKDEEASAAEAPNISIEKTKTEEPEEEVISTPVVSDAVYSANETPSTTGLPSELELLRHEIVVPSAYNTKLSLCQVQN